MDAEAGSAGDLAPFELALATRIVFGVGALESLGQRCAELGAKRVLLVTDAGIVRAGHCARAEATLRAAQLEIERFEVEHEDPTTGDVDACLAVARAFRPELFAALGGGSPIDVAKGANMLLAFGGRLEELRGSKRPLPGLRPLVAVPTTAGTGSEVQSFALIAHAETHEKMACGARDAAARVAILDPETTTTQPARVTACTGLDALGHALETAVTKPRNAISGLFSREAFRLAHAAFPRVLRAPEDLTARGAMLRAATFAGLAIEHSMLGAAHAMANPLSARFDVAHGHAVALGLPWVMRFNAEEPGAAAGYLELARGAGLDARDGREAAVELAGMVLTFMEAGGLPRSLAELGVRAQDCAALAEDATRQWTGRFNPRALSSADFEQLYALALRGPESP